MPIKKRTIVPKPEKRTVENWVPPKVETEVYYVCKIPPEMPSSKLFHDGPVPLTMGWVHRDAFLRGSTTDELYDHLVAKDHWFITKRPGHYLVFSRAFNFNFSFTVDKDGFYDRGWHAEKDDTKDKGPTA